jgi:hypothetical protein
MPPLTGGLSALRRERPGFCIDERKHPRSLALALSLVPPGQGSGQAASLAPRSSLHGERFSTGALPTPLPRDA